MSNPVIVFVTWEDAWVDGALELSLEEASKLEPLKRCSVGILVKETSRCLILATDQIEETKNFQSLMVIPSSMILNRFYVDTEENE